MTKTQLDFSKTKCLWVEKLVITILKILAVEYDGILLLVDFFSDFLEAFKKAFERDKIVNFLPLLVFKINVRKANFQVLSKTMPAAP